MICPLPLPPNYHIQRLHGRKRQRNPSVPKLLPSYRISFHICASSMERTGARGEESVAVPQQTLEVKASAAAAPRKRNPCPGVRNIGGRIYDPQNGKTCHQCRQKTTDFAAACKEAKKKGLCPIHFCHKCLLNRYGEKADEVAKEEAWTCPKCRGICNCSFCRKKKGEMPTGILAHAAKASGHSSVHELLIKGSDMVAAAQTLASIPQKTKKDNPKRALGTDAATDGLLAQGDENIGIDLNAFPSVPINKRLKKGKCRVKDCAADEKFCLENKGEPPMRDESADVVKKIVLPRGTPITNIVGAELEAEDVGPAIQFYEFCRSFSEVFQIRKGQPEKVLQVITGGGRKLREVPSLVADLHINLLSVIQEDREEKPLNYSRDGDDWIIDIGKYISESNLISKDFPLDCLNKGVLGYKNLSPSCKLHVLNFLCDETLSSSKLRNWIDKQNESATERKSAAREIIRVAKEKEKELKERLKNDAKAILLRKAGENPSIEETNNLISQIKEAKEVKEAAIKCLNTASEEKLGGVLRTKPVMVDKGVAYWKLDDYYNRTAIMRQEFDTMGNKDKWFMFTEDEESLIDDHVATRSRHQWKSHSLV